MKTLVFEFSDLSNIAYLVPSHIDAMNKVRQFVKDNWESDLHEPFPYDEVDDADIDEYMGKTETIYVICDIEMDDVYNTVKANQLHDNDEEIIGTVAVKYPDLFNPVVWDDVCEAWEDYLATNDDLCIYEFVELFNEQHKDQSAYQLVVVDLEFHQP